MRQVFQSWGDGEVRVEEVPAPSTSVGEVLVRNRRSLISAGTERQMIEMGRKSLAGKAAERPDLVRQVLEKARRDGILPTARAVLDRLDEPVPLGYSSAGVVLEAGEGVEGFARGTPVACAGAGHAVHAGVVSVPSNLCVPLPEWRSSEEPFEAAAFTTVGSVALQGVRVADLRLGERAVVVGLGLVGLLTVQLLRAAGCRVVGVDPDADRASLGENLGCEAAVTDAGAARAAVDELTGGHGADAVLLTASTGSDQPVRMAAELSREKGRVVVVGAVGLDVPREPYYDRELELRFSRSYGPGRHDPEYEEKGRDYPYGYVRWTEGRNLAAFLELVARGEVRTEPLVTHRFGIAEAGEAYRRIVEAGGEALGVLLSYPAEDDVDDVVEGRDEEAVPATAPARGPAPGGGTGADLWAGPSASGRDTRGIADLPIRLGFVGAGRFAGSVLLPELSDRPDVDLATVCTKTGLSARQAAERFGFDEAVTDPGEVFGDPGIDAVFVATRHDLHAGLVVRALESGKHVFCEKPLCLNRDELAEIEEAWRGAVEAGADTGPPVVMVGYNRRFAPLTDEVHELFDAQPGPVSVLYRVNAGHLPSDHWLRDPEVGGGRIVGEGCHFVDWICHVAGARPVEVSAATTDAGAGGFDDDVTLLIRLSDGSTGAVQYLAGGAERMGKERIEVHGGGASALIDDFRQGAAWTDGGRQRLSRFLAPPQDKGHAAELDAFLEAVETGSPSPVPLEEAAAVTRATFGAVASLRTGRPVRLGREG